MNRMRTCSMVLVLLIGSASMVAPLPSLAQDTSARDRVRRAIERFEAALSATDPDLRRRELEAALAELEEANRLDAEVLLEWNLARIELELGDVVAALEHVERFLSGAPAEAPRRSEAEAMRIALEARVGFLSVTSSAEGARVSIDGELRGTTPMPEIRVASGAITVEVSAPTFRTETRRMRIASQEHASLSVDLERDRGTVGELRMRSSLLDVQVTIDDTVVGTTPLSTTVALPPGPHTLVAERRGYRTLRRTIEVEVGSEQTLDLDLEVDPDAVLGTVVLRVPEVPGRLTIDGAEGDLDDALSMPEGRHTIELDLEEREDWEGEVTVAPGVETELRPELTWQGGVMSRLHDNAETQRITGAIVLAAGGALLVAGATLIAYGAAVAQPEVDTVRARLAFCESSMDACTVGEVSNLRNRLPEVEGVPAIDYGVGAALALVGAIAIPIGAWLFADAPSDDSLRARASASLRIGAGSLILDGTF